MSFAGAVWRVRLFDGPCLESATGDVVDRFRSKKVGSLLAYLALRLGKRVPREELSLALWPEEADEHVLSNRLRFTLASLRRQLEPSGITFGSVLDARVPGCLRLREEAVWCDVFEFDRAMREGRQSDAAELLKGPLMPGYYDEWLRSDQIRFDLLLEERSAEPRAVGSRKLDVPAAPVREMRLPLYLSSFFGREAELLELHHTMSSARLVTLSGPGGIGKTRLAVETASRSSKPCSFVALADLNDPTRIGEVTLAALGISSRSGSDTLLQLAHVLTERPPMVLVLDNAEHLVAEVAEFAMRVLSAVPSLHLLVTSRQRLEVQGETVILIQPLGVPSSSDDLEAMCRHPSVALFLDRAKSVRPDFGIHPKTAEAVAAICQRLDGMPLALELAAVRVTAQSPIQIADALTANLMDLKSRQRGLPERHRSLRAALQGSYELLEPNLQRFFCSLSVFEGGWTASATGVVARNGEPEAYLEELVVRSLVQVTTPSPGELPRYSFLEAIRQFASEQLTEAEAREGRLKHTEYFLGLASKADEDDVRTFLPLDREQENLIKAFAFGGGSECSPSMRDLIWQGLAGALEFAFVRGKHRIAVRWIDEFSPQFASIEDLALRTRIRNAACQILPDVGRSSDARLMVAAMKADSDSSGNEEPAVFAEVIEGYVAEFVSDLNDSLERHRHALSRARVLGNRRLLETSLAHASGTLHGLAAREPAGTTMRINMLSEAESLARELQQIVPAYSRRKPLAPLLLAAALRFQDRLEEALECYKETQQHAIALGTTTERMFAYVFESEIRFELGDAERAALLFGAFQDVQERMGYSLDRAQLDRPAWIIRLDESLRVHLGDDKYESVLRQGRSTSHEYLTVDLP
jgi:predicted ATPase